MVKVKKDRVTLLPDLAVESLELQLVKAREFHVVGEDGLPGEERRVLLAEKAGAENPVPGGRVVGDCHGWTPIQFVVAKSVEAVGRSGWSRSSLTRRPPPRRGPT